MWIPSSWGTTGRESSTFSRTSAQVVYLPRTPEISTTQIKKDLEK